METCPTLWQGILTAESTGHAESRRAAIPSRRRPGQVWKPALRSGKGFSPRRAPRARRRVRFRRAAFRGRCIGATHFRKCVAPMRWQSLAAGGQGQVWKPALRSGKGFSPRRAPGMRSPVGRLSLAAGGQGQVWKPALRSGKGFSPRRAPSARRRIRSRRAAFHGRCIGATHFRKCVAPMRWQSLAARGQSRRAAIPSRRSTAR